MTVTFRSQRAERSESSVSQQGIWFYSMNRLCCKASLHKQSYSIESVL